ncbi:MAG: cell division protein ZapA [Spirochaetota bacterium]
MAVQVVRVDLLGASFSVQTDETREYFETLLGELSRRIDSLRESTHVDEALRLSILANITILDELVRLRREAGEGDEVSRLTERLIRRLDAGLEDSGELSPLPGAAIVVPARD